MPEGAAPEFVEDPDDGDNDVICFVWDEDSTDAERARFLSAIRLSEEAHGLVTPDREGGDDHSKR